MTVLELLAAAPAAFIATLFVLGLLVGSFLNVVIYRVPVMLDRQWRIQCAELAVQQPLVSADDQGDPPLASRASGPVPTSAPFNLVTPRSNCPHCKSPITALQNIPVLSYLVLRGRCANCQAPISRRYPAIEILTALMSAAVAWKFGFGWPALAALVLTWFLIALTFIDLDQQLLPDNMTLPLMWIGLTLSLWGPQAGMGPVPVDMRSSVIGALAGYLSLWSVYHLFRLITGKEGMGYGDFKLLAALGAWLGWKMLIPIILMAAGVGAVTGIALIVIRGRDRSVPIAFGPFLATAGWLMMMFGNELVNSYLGLYGHHP
jgi:leader peptidase (prepilin peptidase) / N-methyltransferase